MNGRFTVFAVMDNLGKPSAGSKVFSESAFPGGVSSKGRKVLFAQNQIKGWNQSDHTCLLRSKSHCKSAYS